MDHNFQYYNNVVVILEIVVLITIPVATGMRLTNCFAHKRKWCIARVPISKSVTLLQYLTGDKLFSIINYGEHKSLPAA